MFNGKNNAQTKVEVVKEVMPYVVITREALINMQLYVQGCHDEIGWLGTAYKNGREILIDKVYLFHQQVHSTTTEITPEGLATFGEEILSNPDVDGVAIWNNLKMWGHSHVNMTCTPSGQDNDQMRTFANSGHDWFIRLIANKRGEMRIDFYDYVNGIAYQDLNYEEQLDGEEEAMLAYINELYQAMDEKKEQRVAAAKLVVNDEIKVKVRKIGYNNHTTTTYHNNNYHPGGWQNNTDHLRQPVVITPESTSIVHTLSDGVKLSDADKKKETNVGSKSLSENTNVDKNYIPLSGNADLDYFIHMNFSKPDLRFLEAAETVEDLEEMLWTDYGIVQTGQVIENLFRYLSNQIVQRYEKFEFTGV